MVGLAPYYSNAVGGVQLYVSLRGFQLVLTGAGLDAFAELASPAAQTVSRYSALGWL